MCGRLRWILHKGRQAGCKINQKLLGMRSVAETGGALALTTAADFVASSFFTPPFFGGPGRLQSRTEAQKGQSKNPTLQ